MDGLKPGAVYRKPLPPPPAKLSPPSSPTKCSPPKPTPRITKEASPSQSLSQGEVDTVSVSKSIQVTNHLVNQNIHIHPTLVKDVAVETVRRGFGESVADACRAAFDNVIKKPSKWFVGLFKKKKK